MDAFLKSYDEVLLIQQEQREGIDAVHEELAVLGRILPVGDPYKRSDPTSQSSQESKRPPLSSHSAHRTMLVLDLSCPSGFTVDSRNPFSVRRQERGDSDPSPWKEEPLRLSPVGRFSPVVSIFT